MRHVFEDTSKWTDTGSSGGFGRRAKAVTSGNATLAPNARRADLNDARNTFIVYFGA
jgi:hypothetical protein